MITIEFDYALWYQVFVVGNMGRSGHGCGIGGSGRKIEIHYPVGSTSSLLSESISILCGKRFRSRESTSNEQTYS